MALCFQHLGLPSPTRLQYDVAWQLQHGPRKQCIQCWRGFGKSYILSIYNVWRLYCDPSDIILNTSAAKKRADDTTRFMLGLIRGIPQLRHLEPDTEAGQKSSTVEFEVGPAPPAHSPSCRSLGITSNSLTGSRATSISADDIETQKNSLTPIMREKIAEATRELDGAILIPGKKSKVVYLGTPQVEDSFYHQLHERGYETLIYPARYPTPDQMEVYEGRIAPILMKDLEKDPSLAGKPTDNVRFPEEELQLRQASYGRQGMLLQFMLMPTLAQRDKFPLRVDDLIVMDVNSDAGPELVIYTADRRNKIPVMGPGNVPMLGFQGDHFHKPLDSHGQWLPYQSSVLAVDPSGRGKDEIGYAAGKALNGVIHYSDFGGLLGGYTDENMVKIATVAKLSKVNIILVEENWGGGMFTQLLAPHLRNVYPQCGIEEIRNTGPKEHRIVDSLEPLLSQHKIVLDRSAIMREYEQIRSRTVENSKEYSAIYQLSRILREPRGNLRFYDRLEAMAMVAKYLVDCVGQDAMSQMGKRMSDESDKALRDFVQMCKNPAAYDASTMKRKKSSAGHAWIGKIW